MNHILRRLVVLCVVVVMAIVTLGCGSQTIGNVAGDQYNPAMSPQQKANLDSRKKAEDDIGKR